MRKACQFIIPLFLAAIFSFSGCKSVKQSECINIDVATALKQAGKFPLSAMVSDVDMIQLDTVKDAYFVNMLSISMTAHFIGFVCDWQKRTYLFNRQGRFIANIGCKGKGPGEFVQPNVLAISPDEKHIVVGDPWSGKLILFDIEGHFVREKVIKQDSPGWRFDVVKFADNESIFVVFRRPETASPGFASILKYDLDFRLTSKILPRPGSEEETESHWYLALMPTHEGICFWEAGRDTVYYIDRDGKASPRYHLDIKNHCFDQEKGKMKLYIPDQAELCTMATKVVDLPGYLYVFVRDNGRNRFLIIDKATNAAFAPDRPIACDTTMSEGLFRTSIENDVFGLLPLNFDQYFPERNELIAIVKPGSALITHNMDCVRQLQVKFPKVRNQLTTLAESRIGWDNTAIVVMKLK